MPPELESFQRDFVAAIDAPASGALAVYRNTVLNGAVQALRSNYPVIEQILGPEMFEQVAVDFAVQFAPDRPVLALYGQQFADWLQAQDWTSELPYLADVARVERLRVESLMAADTEALTLVDVAATDPQMICLRLHPSVRFAWLETPAMSIWLAHQRPLEGTFEPDWKAEGALFCRPGPFVFHTPRISVAAHRLLAGIRSGEILGKALAAAVAIDPRQDCRALFASLVNLGAFAALDRERT